MTSIARTLGSALLAASLVGCGGEQQAAGPGETTRTPPVADPGVVHVHGLGVDPADGTLYAATHTGLFRIPEQGEAQRVAQRAQDTMGFTVVGPGRFLGSGHPDPREDDVRPPLLGLIESTDAGETWQRLSLHGQADFHALAAAHGRVYGYDATSGSFMVTTDRRSWDRRSRLHVLSFAVDPRDADGVVATTPQGPVASRDGGRTWTALPSAPELAVVSWAAAGDLVGAAVDGTVHRSADGGRSWLAAGSVGGRPEALHVSTSRGALVVHVAVSGRGVLESRDGGATFRVRYAEPAA